MLELRDVRLRRGAAVLIDKANLTIFRGDKIGIVGRNGAGKSSLLALLRGEIGPDGGDYSVPGKLHFVSVSQELPRTELTVLEYVRSGFYDGTVFHRVIDNFMVQGGGFEPGMRQKSTREPIRNEADNGLRNVAYSVAMARTPDPHSASSQFFINVADNDFLNHAAPTPQGWGYCVFGHVSDGQDVVNRIKQVRTGSRPGPRRTRPPPSSWIIAPNTAELPSPRARRRSAGPTPGSPAARKFTAV